MGRDTSNARRSAIGFSFCSAVNAGDKFCSPVLPGGEQPYYCEAGSNSSN